MKRYFIGVTLVLLVLSLAGINLLPTHISTVDAANRAVGGTTYDYAPAAAPVAIAWDMVSSTEQNILSQPGADGYSSAGDCFQIEQRPNGPFAILDDSVSIFPPDTQGIIGESDSDEYFCMVDMNNSDNPSGSGTAVWTFDISSATGGLTSISIDMAAMGDFESNDFFTWSYQIDSGAVVPLSTLAGVTDETVSQVYTMDGGATLTLDDPMTVNSTNLINDFVTFTENISGTGSTLTLTLNAQSDGGSEAIAFRDIVIQGEAISDIAWDMVNSTSTNLTSFNISTSAYASPGDCFDKYQRGVSASIPFAVLDDTSSIFPSDTHGIIKEANTDEFFCVVDADGSPNTSLPHTATWTFDISSAIGGLTDISIDMGAMGDFEASGDLITWSYAIDGGGFTDIFTSSVNEAGSYSYVLDSGTTNALNDPISVNGTQLTNDMQTLTASVSGTGSVLTLRLTTANNAGAEAFAFQNIVIQGLESGTAAPAVVMNEVRIDSFVTGDDEFFELYGTPGTSLTGLTYLVIGDGTGGSGVIESVTDLTGQTIPADGYFVTAEATFTQGAVDLTTTLGFENSDNVTHVLAFEFTGASGDDLDTNDDGILDVTPWTSVVDALGLVETVGSGDQYYGVTLGFTDLGPDGSFVPGHAYRCDNGTGTWNIGSFTVGVDDTPGEANDCSVGPAPVFIHEVQGNGSAVAITTTVIVQGIVVGDYQEDDELDGFFIQEETTDEDGLGDTSEGIFVYCGNNCPTNFVDVAEGDLVTVTGDPTEFFNMSQIDVTSGGSIVIDTAGAGLGLVTPATLDLPVPGGFASVDDYYEQFEGMLVTFADTMTVTEHFQLARYGHFLISEGGKIDQYTQIGTLPLNATDYANHLDDVARRSIFLDDIDNIENPLTGVYHPQPNGFSVNTYVRGGATIPSLTGVLHWSWAGSGSNAWRIRPQITNPVSFNNPARPSAPTSTADITVASFNVLNYFNGDGAGGGFPTARGAHTASELTRQTDKLVAAIVAMDADVVGLMEIENDSGGNSALADLVAALNAVAGPGTYDYVDSGIDGTDAIKVAIIYKPAVVTPVGAHQVLDTPAFVNPFSAGTDRNRPALAQTFQVTDASNPSFNAAFTTVVVHLKSKGSGCGAGDDDTTTGQGNCNLTRTAAATALVNWLNTDPTDTATNLGAVDTDFLIIGDFNAYYQEDPMQEFYNAGYSNVLPPTDYTYVFSGQWGSLDHGVSSASLWPQVVSANPWHINADENLLLDYNDTSLDAGEPSYEQKPAANPGLYNADEFRASDHDPVVIGLTMNAAPFVVNTTPLANATNVPIDTDITIEFNEDVTVSNASFTIYCAVSQSHIFALSGSGNAYTLNPDADFADGELCTVRVVSTEVSDIDSNIMLADYVFNFTTAGEPTVVDPAISKIGVLLPGELGLPGETLTWVITVTAPDSIDLTNVVVSDTLRPELQIEDATTTSGSVAIAGQTVTVTIPSMSAGSTVTIEIVTTVLSNPAAGVFTNTANLTADGAVAVSASATLNGVSDLPATGYPQKLRW